MAANAIQLAYSHVPFGKPFLAAVGVPAETVPPSEGYVRFIVTPGGPTLDMLTTGEPVMLGDGYTGGWDVVARPGRVALTRWQGGQPLKQEVPVTMDVLASHATGVDVEDEWLALERMARPPAGAEPPKLTIAGPVSHTDRQWVIDSLTVDQAAVKRNDSNRLIRLEATVTLLQFVTPDIADYADPDAASKKAHGARPDQTIVRTGDTLRIVAKRELHSGRREKWTAIRKLNPALKTYGPDRLLTPGVQIRLPNK